MTCVQISHDFFTLGVGQCCNFVVQVDHAVIDIDAKAVKELFVLFEGIFVEDLDAVTKHDGV